MLGIFAVVQLISGLVQAGLATGEQIKSQIEAMRGKTLTDAECDALIDGIIDDATRRKAMAQQDVIDADKQ